MAVENSTGCFFGADAFSETNAPYTVYMLEHPAALRLPARKRQKPVLQQVLRLTQRWDAFEVRRTRKQLMAIGQQLLELQ